MIPLFFAAALTQAGEASLSRVPTTEAATPGLLRLGLDGGYSRSGTFPEPGTTHGRVETGVIFGYGVNEHWDLFGSISGATLSGGATQVLSRGDLRLGVKWRPSGDEAHFALDAQLFVPSGIDGAWPAIKGAGLELRGLYGLPIGELGSFALRFDSVFGVAIDHTESLLGKAEASPAVRYGLGISSYDQLVLGVGLSARSGDWQPYLELTSRSPIGYEADTTFSSGMQASARRLTSGVRWAVAKGASLDLALDLAIGRTAASLGYATAPPVELRAGFSIAFDPSFALGEKPPPEVRTVYVEKPAPPPEIIRVPAPTPPATDGVVKGVVRSGGVPIADVIIDDGVTRTATDAEGRFELKAPAGKANLIFRHPDYEPFTTPQQVVAGTRLALDVTLAPAQLASIALHAASPIAGALTVVLEGPASRRSTVQAGDSLLLDHLAPGDYRLVVSGPQVLAKARAFTVRAKQVTPIELALASRAEASLLDPASGTGFKNPLQFTGNQLAAVSQPALDELADVLLVAHPEAHVTITGVAGKGAKATVAAAARADEVAQALAARGVAPARVSIAIGPVPKGVRGSPLVLVSW